MKKTVQLGYKYRIGLMLATLIAVLVLNSVSVKQDFEDVQTSVTSIYKDRLLASTYIFDLTDQLYQKRMLAENQGTAAQSSAADANINALIAKYETTFLTEDERKHWSSFKVHLSNYNRPVGHEKSSEFTQTLLSLKQLSALQAGEGTSLYKNASRIVSASSLHTYLETCIALLIGALTLSLIGNSKMRFNTTQANPSLN